MSNSNMREHSPAQLISWVFFMLPTELRFIGLLFEVFSRIIINYDLDYNMEYVYIYVEVADSEANTYIAREN